MGKDHDETTLSPSSNNVDKSKQRPLLNRKCQSKLLHAFISTILLSIERIKPNYALKIGKINLRIVNVYFDINTQETPV